MFLLIHTDAGFITDIFQIYIPLCFYLYETSINNNPSLFTFTFHYVSTYTSSLVGMNPPYHHLHSTMFLLIRWKRLEPENNYKIYIPLCFYLYWAYRNWTPRRKPFTFHYVSTYTMWMPEACPQQTVFTFHYVSTYTHQQTCVCMA